MSFRSTSSSPGLPTAPPTARLAAVLAAGLTRDTDALFFNKKKKEPEPVDELEALGMKKWQEPKLGQEMPFSPSSTARVFVDRLAIFITRSTVEQPPESNPPLNVGWVVVNDNEVRVAYYGRVDEAFKKPNPRKRDTTGMPKHIYLYTRPDESAPFRFNGKITPMGGRWFPDHLKTYIEFKLEDVDRELFQANNEWFA